MKEAQWVPSGIQHDPQIGRIAVGRLPGRNGATGGKRSGDAGFDVVYSDLEVHHHDLLARLLRPDRRLVKVVGTEGKAIASASADCTDSVRHTIVAACWSSTISSSLMPTII